jgi:hypothetical protein
MVNTQLGSEGDVFCEFANAMPAKTSSLEAPDFAFF